MATVIPPVIDPSRTRIQEAVSHSPFNIFNIVAIVLIVVIGFYLYKRFIVKKPQRRFPLVQPVAPPVKIAVPNAPVAEEEVPTIVEETEEEEEAEDAKDE